MSIEYLTPWDAQGNRVITDDGVCFAIREGGTMGYVLAEVEERKDTNGAYTLGFTGKSSE